MDRDGHQWNLDLGSGERTMLRLAYAFLILALIVGAVVVAGPADEMADAWKAGFLLLLVLFIVSATASALRGKPPTR